MFQKSGLFKEAFFFLSLFCLHTTIFSKQKDSMLPGKVAPLTFYPSMTLENPLNSGRFGLIVLGATIENKTRIANEPDANAGIYVGLGAPERFVGAGATLNIYGLSNKVGEQQNLGQGSLSFHINRLFLQNKFLLDAGWENAIYWGGNNQSYISYQRSLYFSGNYLLYSKPENLQKPFGYLSITAGIGNGSFRRDENYTTVKSGSFDPFFSIATPVFKGTNILTEWNGYDITAGISSIPFQKIPFLFTVEITDLIFGNPRIAASVSLPFNLGKPKKDKNGLPVRPIGIKPVRPVRTI
jgi:hypothetical protein